MRRAASPSIAGGVARSAVRVRAALIAAMWTAVGAGAAAAGPGKTWKQTTAKDFEEGEAQGAAILPTGDVVPGFRATRLPVEAAFAWCAAPARDGRAVYFGTGDGGELFVVDGAGGTSARKLGAIDAPWVTALVDAGGGRLLAGSTPGGKVFSVEATQGASKPFGTVAAEHVWALVQDARGKLTYVAAGSPGKVFALGEAGGAARVVWDSGDEHVVALAQAEDGRLLAGTSDDGLLYEVFPDGRAAALHDFDADEVRAIVPAGGAIYLAVNDFERTDAAPPIAAPARVPAGTRVQVAVGASPASAGSLPRPGALRAKGAIYRLDKDGSIEQLHTLADGYFTALLVEKNGDVYAAAGAEGKLYKIAPDRSVTVAVDLTERQILSLARAPGGGYLVGTGDVGGAYRIVAASGDASYVSKVFDAQGQARWGRLRVSGTRDLAVETRSGATARPDKAWRDWQKLEAFGFDGDDGSGKVASAAARYFQYRVKLPPGGALREAELSYLPQNQRARVTELTAESGSGGAPAADKTRSPILKLRWKVENPDGDELIYRLHYRPEGGGPWRPLGGPEPLSKPEHDWNTDAVPDGRYVVRVWASDETVTPADRALDSTFEAPPLLVDNTRPRVENLRAPAGKLAGVAVDGASAIARIEYSVDGGPWRPATPDDGLLDQKREAFSATLPALDPGGHVVTVRALDAADNVGAAHVVVTVK